MSWTAEQRILALFRHHKEQPSGWRTAIPVVLNGHQAARLEPVTAVDHEQPPLVDLLAKWREAAQDSFPTQFAITLEGTRNWLADKVLGVPDRILFWIRGDHDGVRLGHLGLFHLDATAKSIELDNVVRGVQRTMPGLIQAAVRTLMRWTADDLGLEEMSLRVCADNLRAVRLYERCGYRVVREIQLVKLVEPQVTRWVEQSEYPHLRSERRFLEMRRRIGEAMIPPAPDRIAA
ncbi:MAG TPA: GNAT family N-acetyltransferase [Gemmataceae bacterium]|nr:GNAT family N-acetyltransferase [Gemmataceae bacterium]